MPQRYREVIKWPSKKSGNPNIQICSLAAETDQIRHNRLSCWLLVMKLNRIIIQTCSVAAALRSLIVSSFQLIVVWYSTRWAKQGCLQTHNLVPGAILFVFEHLSCNIISLLCVCVCVCLLLKLTKYSSSLKLSKQRQKSCMFHTGEEVWSPRQVSYTWAIQPP